MELSPMLHKILGTCFHLFRSGLRLMCDILGSYPQPSGTTSSFRMNTMRRSTISSSKVRASPLLDYRRGIVNRLLLLACALAPDLALLPQGDMTEVGEKGKFSSKPTMFALSELNPSLQELL